MRAQDTLALLEICFGGAILFVLSLHTTYTKIIAGRLKLAERETGSIRAVPQPRGIYSTVQLRKFFYPSTHELSRPKPLDGKSPRAPYHGGRRQAYTRLLLQHSHLPVLADIQAAGWALRKEAAKELSKTAWQSHQAQAPAWGIHIHKSDPVVGSNDVTDVRGYP